MLVLPALVLDCPETVYADDDDPDVFYAVASGPRLQRTDSGDAMLVFHKYRTVLPGSATAGGGGFLELQTEFVVDDVGRARVLALLAARSGADGRTPVLRTPTYVDGTAELVTTAPGPAGAGEEITVDRAVTPPSLSDDNAAVFSCTLSQDEAAFLWTHLHTIPSPVMVHYDLSMLARLPPGRAHVWLHAGPLRAAWPELAPLDPAARRTALADRGIAGVDLLDRPSVAEPTPGVDLVRWGWELLDRATGGALAGPKEVDWARVSDGDTTVTARSTVPWPVRVASRLSAAAGGTYREVDTGDPVFERLDVTSRCNVDFTRNRIHSVTLQLSYGDRQHTAVFTDTTATDRFHAMLDPDLGHRYSYRAVVRFHGTSRVVELPEVHADGRLLVVSVGDVGYLQIDVFGAVDWTRTEVVTVHLTYADPARGVPAREDAVVLRPEARDAHYERPVWALVDQQWQYRVVYVLRDGRRVERPAETRSGRFVLVDEPFDRHLMVWMVAPGGFSLVTLHRVECVHETSDGVVAQAFALTADAPTAVWSLGLLPGEDDDFRYRVLTVFTDGRSVQGDWVPANGTRTVLVGDRAARLLSVRVIADLLDLGVVRTVQVELSHLSTAGLATRRTLLFLPGGPLEQAWTVPLTGDDPARYSWSARYVLADGSQRTAAGTDVTDEVLLLELPPA